MCHLRRLETGMPARKGHLTRDDENLETPSGR